MTPARADPARWLFGCLAGSLALAIVLHHAWWTGFVVVDRRFLVVLAALWCLARPASVGRFALFAAVLILHCALSLPAVGDHVLLVAFAGSGALAVVGADLARTRRLPAPGALFVRVAPLLRAAVVVLYAAAAFAKLNQDFLDPASSYATAMAPDVAWVREPVIWATLAAEASLAVLLSVRRTRAAGVALGVAFHLVLALAGNVPFAAVALALYVAFVAPEAVAAGRPAPGRGPPARLAFAGAVGAWLALAVLAPEPAVAGGAPGVLARAAIVVWVLVAAVALGPALARRRPPPARRGHPALAAGLAVLVLNAATPYLGVESRGSFTMFSNLRTEPGAWNHLVVPAGARIFAP